MNNSIKKPSLGFSVLLLGLVSAVMCVVMIVFKAKLQTGLFLSWLIAIPMLLSLNYKFDQLENFAYDMIRKVLQPSIIILVVGAMIATWILAGTVPTMIYVGLKLITPKYFLVTALFFCSLVSLFTGTSWGTMGTAGVAMMGVGMGLGIPAGMTAGAVICGAYFGDKMSPVSDSTNLAPAVSGAKLFDHIRHMVWTTAPSYVITAVIFTVLGMKYSMGTIDLATVNAISDKLSSLFLVGFIPMIPALVVFTLLFLKKPPVSTLMVGVLLGALVAIVYQNSGVPIMAKLKDVLGAIYSGVKLETGVPELDKLLNRGGIASMYDIIGIFFFALGLGGMLQGSGVLSTLLESFASRIKSTRGVVIATMLVVYVSNMIGATISFAAVMTGTLMAPVYRDWKLKPENLSRIIEDCGTLGGPIIPWNTGAAYAASVLSVSPLEFIPYCFLSFINPIISLIYGMTGFTMTRYTDEEIEAMEQKA